MRGKRVKELRTNLRPKWDAVHFASKGKGTDIMPFSGVFRRFKRDYTLGLIDKNGKKTNQKEETNETS